MDNSGFIGDKDLDVLSKNEKFQQQKISQQPQYAHTFEEAIALTGCGRFHYQLLFTCGICFLSVMVQITCVSVILPSVRCDLPATLSEQGFLASSGFLGVVLSSHAMGFLADTWGRVRTLRWSLVLSTVVALVSAFSVNIWMLIVFRFLTGFFISGCQACVFSLCGEFHSNATRVRHVTLLSVFLPVALIYIPAAAIFILPIHTDFAIFGMIISPWRWLLVANCVISLVAYVGLVYTPETPKYDLIQGDQEAALNTMREIFVKNTHRPVEEYPVRYVKLDASGASVADIHGLKDAVLMIWSQTVPLFYKERVLQTINICCILFVCYGISHGIFMWYPTILNDLINRQGERICLVVKDVDVTAHNVDICNSEVDTFSFVVLIYVGLAFTGVYLVFAFTIEYIGKKNLLMIWISICIVCCICIQWITQFALSVMVLTVIIAIGNCGGLISPIAVDYFPTNINAMAMCFIMMIGRLGAVAGSNIFGQILFGHCENVFWALTAIMVMLGVMGWCLPEKKPEKPRHENDHGIVNGRYEETA